MMRQRKNKAATDHSSTEKAEEPEFLDEQEQEKLIRAYREEAEEHQKLVQGVFSRICECAIVLSLLLGLSRQDWICWTHVVVACGLHWNAKQAITMTNSKTESTTKISLLVGLMILGLVLAQHWLEKRGPAAQVHAHETINPHVGLALTNFLTMICAWYLQNDDKDTHKALNELESAKYRYKSL